jgi:DNA (cytosine-5)-methyltransferase 1
LVLIASLLDTIKFPPETHGPGNSKQKYSTPREWIDNLPPIEAGETHQEISNHQAMNLSELNLRRIQATPIGGDRRDWPQELELECHTNGYTGHTDVYGRIKWDELSSCLTTKCTSLSNGRFGHPEQNRAISAREAACLQTFPRDFVFEGGISLVARQIGNAVPVLLAQQFGENFNKHLKDYLEGKVNG